jgi:short subunit dehydrogenase-like uncharacterized protein
MSDWMIYGANGYTGRLIAAEAVTRGLSPVLAGRNRQAVEALARELGLAHRVFDLQDGQAVDEGLRDMKLVLHCAGPFSRTSAPMLDGCFRHGVHYLDITGEIAVFEAAWKRSREAQEADIVVCPGAGFDVVPTDCLAAMLVQRLPAATSLALAFEPGGGMSRGTAKTSVEGLGQGGCVRRDGQLQRVPLAWKTRRIPFAHAERYAVTIPWGDVFTAWVSTGVPDIEVYLSVPPATVRRLRRLRRIQPLLRLSFVQGFMKGRIDRRSPGPDAERRAHSETQLWGEVRSADGRTVSATMTTPNGYDLTVTGSLGLVRFLLENEVEGGFYTPSLLAGAEFVRTLPGVEVNFSENAG